MYIYVCISESIRIYVYISEGIWIYTYICVYMGESMRILEWGGVAIPRDENFLRERGGRLRDSVLRQSVSQSVNHLLPGPRKPLFSRKSWFCIFMKKCDFAKKWECVTFTLKVVNPCNVLVFAILTPNTPKNPGALRAPDYFMSL